MSVKFNDNDDVKFHVNGARLKAAATNSNTTSTAAAGGPALRDRQPQIQPQRSGGTPALRALARHALRYGLRSCDPVRLTFFGFLELG
jgi:hypothetical protein